jgi:hypothetical protein
VAIRTPPLSVVSMNTAAPETIIVSTHVVMGIRPLSVVSIHIVASATAVFQVIMRIQPHLVVFMDAAATAVVELAAFVTVVRPTALCMVRPTALCSNNVSAGSQSRL